jgi:hypothetical protein
MQDIIQISTPAQNGLYDITPQVEAIVAESKVKTGMVNVYVQGATAGIMIEFKFIAPLFDINFTSYVPLSLQHESSNYRSVGFIQYSIIISRNCFE